MNSEIVAASLRWETNVTTRPYNLQLFKQFTVAVKREKIVLWKIAILRLETKVPHRARTKRSNPSKDIKKTKKTWERWLIQSLGLAFVLSEDLVQYLWLKSLCFYDRVSLALGSEILLSMNLYRSMNLYNVFMTTFEP